MSFLTPLWMKNVPFSCAKNDIRCYDTELYVLMQNRTTKNCQNPNCLEVHICWSQKVQKIIQGPSTWALITQREHIFLAHIVHTSEALHRSPPTCDWLQLNGAVGAGVNWNHHKLQLSRVASPVRVYPRIATKHKLFSTAFHPDCCVFIHSFGYVTPHKYMLWLNWLEVMPFRRRLSSLFPLISNYPNIL